jgi:hypothetical protein
MRLESPAAGNLPGVITLELLDSESTPQTVLTTVHRMKLADFAGLGKPSIGDKLKLTLEIVKEPAPAPTSQ